MKRFNRLLIANRGEIAQRIIATAKALGIETVAVYSDIEAQALHVQQADFSFCIGPAEISQSYLNGDAILQAARATSAQAIHPGYGFLSENADFADAVTQAGFNFIGPPVSAMRLMAHKRAAKLHVQSLGIPLVPGYNGDDQTINTLYQQALAIGLPVMLKAAAGGGGKGMRKVCRKDDLRSAIEAAKREALASFGSDQLLIERALESPRHVEVQIFADQQGHCVYIGDRDCSIQRRHQKVIEEAPAPNLNEALRCRMGEAAVAIARSCDYVGAGTVEFLLDDNQQFYFLEMNTRLQVEHPVTELCYGIDLVEWQINVAMGLPLPLTQTQIIPKAHAIEARLYAEKPDQEFLPQTGEVYYWHTLPDSQKRIDHCLYPSQSISAHFDPLLAKLIASGDNRDQALTQLNQLIDETVLLGVEHNLRFLRRCINLEDFQQAHLSTRFLTEHPLQTTEPEIQTHMLLLAAVFEHIQAQPKGLTHNHFYTRLACLSQPYSLTFEQQEQSARVQLLTQHWHLGQLTLIFDGQTHHISHIQHRVKEQCHHLQCQIGPARARAWLVRQDGEIWLQYQGQSARFRLSAPLIRQQRQEGQLSAPMAGRIVKCLVAPNSQVNAGDTLLIMEAMKMELTVSANNSGQIELMVQAGDQVKAGQLLAHIQPAQRN